MRRARKFALLIALVATTPGWAYTIYTKAGARIIAREKPVIEGDLAIFYQPSGTKSSMPAAEIDIKRTEEANVDNLSSTAYVIEGGTATDLKKDKTPPKVRPRIQDLIKSDQAGLRTDRISASDAPLLPAAATRIEDSKKGASGDGTRAPFVNIGLGGEIRSFIVARGVTGVELFAGTSATWPLVVYNTSSEGAVFKALVTGANALLHFRSSRPTELDGLEILCDTGDGGSGGRFVLTPEHATAIVSGSTEITRFYLDNVQF